MARVPVAFLSYVRLDDQHENGRLSEFCQRLSGEVRLQTGETFHIFQDRNDIRWGEQWQRSCPREWCKSGFGFALSGRGGQ